MLIDSLFTVLLPAEETGGQSRALRVRAGRSARLALGWLRVRYPLSDDVERHVTVEYQFGHVLDSAVFAPWIEQLYRWSATEP